MTCEWKARKSTNRISSLPTALGNRRRDSHIPTRPTTMPILKQGTNPTQKLLPISPVCFVTYRPGRIARHATALFPPGYAGLVKASSSTHPVLFGLTDIPFHTKV